VKKLLIIFFSVLLFSQVYSQKKILTLEDSLNEYIDDSFSRSSLVAYNFFNLTKNRSIASRNDSILMRPASVLKLFTTTSVLYFSNEDKFFETTLFHDGKIISSSLKGNVFLKGSLDPFLSIAQLDSLVLILKQSGIRTIKGNFIFDLSLKDTIEWGSGWMWDDSPYGYTPKLSALNIESNIISIITYPDSKLGKPRITLYPDIPYFNIINKAVTSNKDTKTNLQFERYLAKNKENIIIKGNISIADSLDKTTISIASPLKYASELIKSSLKKYNISFHGKFIQGKVKEDASSKLGSIKNPTNHTIYKTNKTSSNIGAEMLLLKLASTKLKENISYKDGLKFNDSLAAIVSPGLVNIFADASGLSFYNMLSSKAINDLLIFVYKNRELFYYIYSSLPIAGIDGSLKNRFINTNLEKRLRAKTGTLSGVTSLAGYFYSKENDLIAFTLLLNNYKESASQARNFADNFCLFFYNNYKSEN
jgi:D-alanyl-D-alanine carboxypeptidase/D-alanyl-D-alanine-endopeptidase (penicillin-binding protein 4)